VARALIEKGFKKVRPLEGGLDGWIAAGYGVTEDAIIIAASAASAASPD
jgi:3-mercaptopyruvate sulfurtransferase SseA